jgi:ADP-ribose diphosphatase
MNVVLAEQLFPSRLAGDEPEAIDVLPWRLDQLEQLLARDDISEARTIAALLIVRERQRQKGLL